MAGIEQGAGIETALAPTLAPAGDPEGMDDLVYLKRMLDAGAGEAMDGLAVHAYGWQMPPDAPADPAVVNFSRTELAYQLLVEAGYADMPVYITEGGWNDHPRWTMSVSPAQRTVTATPGSPPQGRHRARKALGPGIGARRV